MTKSELRTGMIVTLRNGEHKTVFLDVCKTNSKGIASLIIGADGIWDDLIGYNNDLTYKGNSRLDIVKVEAIKFKYDILNPFSTCEGTNLIWERPEPAKKITISEIEKLLGYKVEIINDK